MRKEIELLKDHADAAPQIDVLDVRIGHAEPVDDHVAGVDRNEPIDAAQHRRLSAAGRPDDTTHLARVDGERDVLENLVLAERFADVR